MEENFFKRFKENHKPKKINGGVYVNVSTNGNVAAAGIYPAD